VRALDAANNPSAYSSIVNASTLDGQAPTAPTGLAPVVVSSTQINLSWTASSDNVGVTGYRVERCQGTGCSNFTQVATPAATTLNDTGRASSTSYSYRVFALDAANNVSPASNTVSATTQAPPDTQPPTAPSGLGANAVSSTQINLSWTASSDNVGVTGYRVERCQGSGCSSFAQIATPAGTTLNDTGRIASTSYSYRVFAVDAATNVSPASNVASATTPAPPDTQPPTAPTNLTPSVISGTQINMSWTVATDNVGVTSYQVQRCQGAGCASFATVGTLASTTFNNTGLTAATTYRYQVIALDAANNASPPSSIVSATTQTPPTAPAGVTVTAASATEIDLAWSASMSGVGMAGYVVERCQGASCSSFAQIGSLTANTVFYDSPLTAGTSYSYRIRARDTGGTESANSTVLTQVTLTAGSCD